MSAQDNKPGRVISVDDLVSEMNALESTFKADDFDTGYQTAVSDMFSIIERLQKLPALENTEAHA